MLTKYEPGKPNRYFLKHKYFGIPLNRNIEPIENCKLKGFVRMDAQAYRGIATHPLDAEHLWATFQAEAEDLIRVDGKLTGNDQERNKRINAAYAKLWLADNRFQWAGLAAFASKLVGCGLLHARELSDKSKDELKSIWNWAGSSTEAAGMSAMPTIIRNSSDYMYDQLGFGNKHLFLDIYPLHRFYMARLGGVQRVPANEAEHQGAGELGC